MPPEDHISRRSIVCGLGATAAIASTPVGAQSSANTILGAGATVPARILEVWGEELGQAIGIDLAYRPVGSSAGLDAIADRAVDFGVSDTSLDLLELAELQVVEFPVVISALVFVTNLPGTEDSTLWLNPELIRGIFSGEIRVWSDQRIAQLNPDVILPHLQITPIVRADRSGSTVHVANYLIDETPEFSAPVEHMLRIPFGLRAVGSHGVASTVRRLDGAIGYVGYSVAAQFGLQRAVLRNKSGRYPLADRPSMYAAARLLGGDVPPEDFATTEATAWPIIVRSKVVLPRGDEYAESNKLVTAFFDRVFQYGDAMAWRMGFVPLDEDSKRNARAVMRVVSGGP